VLIVDNFGFLYYLGFVRGDAIRGERYLALQTVRGAADSANKHDVTNDSILHYNRTINAISSEVVYW